jgi:hypothetical protein
MIEDVRGRNICLSSECYESAFIVHIGYASIAQFTLRESFVHLKQGAKHKHESTSSVELRKDRINGCRTYAIFLTNKRN